MAGSAPTNETIIFPAGRDSFPTVYDANTSNVPDRYSKVWAEYYNKIRNFIGKVQPLIRATVNSSYTTDETLISITEPYQLEPAPTLSDLLQANSNLAYSQGKAIPSNVLPFEIVITKSNDDYSAWNTLGTRLLYKTTAAELSNIAGGLDFFSLTPMVQAGVKLTNTFDFTNKYVVNCYVIPSADTLLIRGSIISLTQVSALTTGLPDINRHFPSPDQHYLSISLTFINEGS